ncbi:MAG: hypothetical protein IJD97_01085 [Clostridia bacterium]|nr:hypothetical protein [Clostridia bacterium]
MLSKMSFLNKSIIKSDLKRFWYLAALNTLVTFFLGTFIVMDRYRWGDRYYGAAFGIPNDYYIAMFVGMAFSLLTTVAVFSYLNKSEQTAFAHAFPNTRKKQYISHLISAFILCASSGIINTIMILIYRFNDNVAKSVSPVVAFKFLAVYITYSALIIALTAFTQMLTGSSVACTVLTLCFAAIPVALEGFIKAFCEAHVYGFEADNEFFTADVFYLSMVKILSWKVLIYLALIAVLLLAGYFLYKIRRLECYGEVCAFTETRPVFIYTVALFTGMASYLYFGSFYDPNIFFLLPFGIIGIIIAYMLSRKSLNIKGVHKPILVYALAVVLLFAAVKLDITGYERRVPDAGSVEYVLLPGRTDYDAEGFYARISENDLDHYHFRYAEPFDGRITDFAEIENIVKLHSHLIEDRQDSGRFIRLSYKMKNGSTINRRYRVDVHDDIDYLKPIYDSEKYRGMMVEFANGQKKDITTVSLSDMRLGSTLYYHKELNEEQIKMLSDAFIKDVLETPYEEMDGIYERNNVNPTTIRFTFYVDGKFEKEGATETRAKRELAYGISPNYKNTIAVLTNLGFYDSLPTYEEVAEIGVNIHTLFYAEDGYSTASAERAVSYVTSEYRSDMSYMYKITEPSEIEEVYSFIDKDIVIYPGEEKRGHEAEVFIIMKNGTVLNLNLFCHEKYWPAAIRNLISE